MKRLRETYNDTNFGLDAQALLPDLLQAVLNGAQTFLLLQPLQGHVGLTTAKTSHMSIEMKDVINQWKCANKQNEANCRAILATYVGESKFSSPRRYDVKTRTVIMEVNINQRKSVEKKLNTLTTP